MSGASSHTETAHYGTWKSPLTPDVVTGQVLGLGSPRVAANGKIYYLEQRPSGKSIIVEIADGKSRDVLPENYNCRSSVHEYGGAAYQLTPTGDIVFTDADSKAVYLLKPATGDIKKILEKTNCRYGDFEIHPDSKSIAAIEEDHTHPEPKDVVNRLVLFDFESGKTTTLRSGRDFFIGPRFSPDGKRIAWLEYNHPNMPWTGAELHIADFTADGKLENDVHVAGKGGEECATHHLWAPDGRLFFARDRTGHWQLAYTKPGSTKAEDFPLKGLEDVDLGEPEWQLGPHSRTILPGGKTMVAIYWKHASAEIISIDLSTGSWKPLKLSFRDLRGDVLTALSSDSIVLISATSTTNKGLYKVTLSSTYPTLLKTSLDYTLSEPYISIPKHISCPTTDNATTYGFYYAPKNPKYHGPKDTLPPLILFAHGGPTGNVTSAFNLGIQYFTTRGYAVFDINYRGSAGYGRDYIRQLDGVWGIADSDDGAAAVEYLTKEGLIDKTRCGVRGGSAGGYFTIQAVCYKGIWAGGNSLFGISDLHSFVETTHKFESLYADGLLFPKNATAEEREKIIVERSAISHVERIDAPLLLLQGSVDRIVPPEQSSDLLEAARKVGKTVEMTVYEGEGHGFRKAANLKDAIEKEEMWWRKYLLREWAE